MFLLFFLSILVVSNCQNTEETTQNYEEKEFDMDEASYNNNTTPSSNETKNFDGKNIEMERIMQPFQPHEGRTLNESIPTTLKPEALKDFRPSPQLEPIYEFNKFPVPPAHPEAKTFPSYSLGLSSKLPTAPWLEKSVKYSFTTESPWATKVRFPSPTPTFGIKNKPYHFVTADDPFSSTEVGAQKKPDTYADFGQKNLPKGTVGASLAVQDGFGSTGLAKPFSSEGYLPPSLNHGIGSVSPPFYGGGHSDGHQRPSLLGFSTGGGKGNELKGSSFEKPGYLPAPEIDSSKDSFALSPWKKIIKFLTAVIPIGLLISALTPSVINVSPVNASYNYQGRGRSEGRYKIQGTQLEILSQLDKEGCEERVLCELLLNAGSSANAQQHIENLLETFIGDGGDRLRQKAELNRIFEAVKKENCKSLTCQQIKEDSVEVTEDDRK